MSENINPELQTSLLGNASQSVSQVEELIKKSMPAGNTAEHFRNIINSYHERKLSRDDAIRLLNEVLDEILARLAKHDDAKRNTWLNDFFSSLMFKNPKEANYPKVRKRADEYINTFISRANKKESNVKANICSSIDSIMNGKFAKAIDNKSHYICDGLGSQQNLFWCASVNCLHGGWVAGPVVGIICSVIAILGSIIIPMVEIITKKYDYEKLCEQGGAINKSVNTYRNSECAAPSQDEPTPEKLPVKERVQQAQNKQNEINESDVSKVGDKITEKNDERNQ